VVRAWQPPLVSAQRAAERLGSMVHHGHELAGILRPGCVLTDDPLHEQRGARPRDRPGHGRADGPGPAAQRSAPAQRPHDLHTPTSGVLDHALQHLGELPGGCARVGEGGAGAALGQARRPGPRCLQAVTGEGCRSARHVRCALQSGTRGRSDSAAHAGTERAPALGTGAGPTGLCSTERARVVRPLIPCHGCLLLSCARRAAVRARMPLPGVRGRLPHTPSYDTAPLDRSPVATALFATLITSLGPIRVQLFPDHAPKTVRNFVGLADGSQDWTDPRSRKKADGPLYPGTVFHRVIPGFMIQGGDPLGSGRGGPGYQFKDEIHPELAFTRPYLLAMANAGPGTNGSQFFITVAPTTHLTGKHTIFGEVADQASRDVVDAIAATPTGRDDRPRTDVVIEQVEVEQVES